MHFFSSSCWLGLQHGICNPVCRNVRHWQDELCEEVWIKRGLEISRKQIWNIAVLHSSNNELGVGCAKWRNTNMFWHCSLVNRNRKHMKSPGFARAQIRKAKKNVLYRPAAQVYIRNGFAQREATTLQLQCLHCPHHSSNTGWADRGHTKAHPIASTKSLGQQW